MVAIAAMVAVCVGSSGRSKWNLGWPMTAAVAMDRCHCHLGGDVVVVCIATVTIRRGLFTCHCGLSVGLLATNEREASFSVAAVLVVSQLASLANSICIQLLTAQFVTLMIGLEEERISPTENNTKWWVLFDTKTTS